MAELVGQKKLNLFLDDLSIDNLPNSLILKGLEGCGKHFFASMIADKVKLPLIDVTENISYEMISDIYQKAIPSIYLIDLNKMPIKNQEVILKFFEEPLKNIFIICLVDLMTYIPRTIVNRGVVLNFEPYSSSELQQFCKVEDDYTDYFLDVLKTPGDVLSVYKLNIKLRDIDSLCKKMCEQLQSASLPNTLTIGEKINYKDEYDKFDLKIFLRMLDIRLLEYYMKRKNIVYMKASSIVKKTMSKFSDVRINKKLAVENMLIDLWSMFI